jgi:hypothetical protein
MVSGGDGVAVGSGEGDGDGKIVGVSAGRGAGVEVGNTRVGNNVGTWYGVANIGTVGT